MHNLSFAMKTSIGLLHVTATAIVQGNPFQKGSIQISLLQVKNSDTDRIFPIGPLLAEIKAELRVQVEMLYDATKMALELQNVGVSALR